MRPASKFLSLWLFFGFCMAAPAVAQSFNKAYGMVTITPPPVPYDESAFSIANTVDNNYVITGYSSSLSDLIAMKISNTGTILWKGLYANPTAPTQSRGYCIDKAVDQDGQDNGYIVTGYFNGAYISTANDIVRKKLLLLKLASNGTVQWQRVFGSDADHPETGYDVEGRYVIQTSDLGFVAVGFKRDSINNTRSIVLVKVNSSGTKVWYHTYAIADSIKLEGWCVKQTDDNNNGQLDNSDGFIITGGYNNNYNVFVMKVQSNGAFNWMKSYHEISNIAHAEHIEPISLGVNGYIVAGTRNSPNTGEDVFLLRITNTGNVLWARSLGDTDPSHTNGDPNADQGHAVKQDQNGNFVVAGGSYSYGMSHQGILYKVDNTGALLSGYHFGGGNDDHVEDIVVASDGSYAMTGHSDSFTRGSTEDIYVVKTDAGGQFCLAYECTPHDSVVRMMPVNESVNVNDTIFTYVSILDQGNPIFITGTECDGGIQQGSTDVPEATMPVSGLAVYPNPLVGGSCTAAFTIEESGWTELAVYNTLGVVVATPVSSYLPKGSYTLPVESSSLPSGTYMCRLTSAGHRSAVRLVIIR